MKLLLAYWQSAFKRSQSLLFIFNSNLYPLLLTADTVFYFYNVFSLSYNYFCKNIISLLISLITFILYYSLGCPQKEHISLTKKSDIRVYLFVALHFLFPLMNQEEFIQDVNGNLSFYSPTEHLWKLLVLDALTSSTFIKLLYIIVCVHFHLNWGFAISLRLISTIVLSLFFRFTHFVEDNKLKKQTLESDFELGNKLEEQNATIEEGRKRDHNTKYNEQDYKLIAKIFNQMLEGVVVLDNNGKVKYMNHYMKSILDFEEGISLTELSQNLSNFVFKEASIQGDHTISSRVQSQTYFNENYSQDKTYKSLNRLTRDEFLSKVQSINTLEDLFNSCMREPDTQEATSRYVPTFQTRYYHQHYNEWYSMEVKANFFCDNTEKYLIIIWRDTTERENKIISLEEEKVNFRNNLLASFSHELRTPLNANLAFLEQTMDIPSIPYRIKEELIKPALISGKLLFFLIKDILDYSQMIYNKLDLQIRSRNITQTINQCIELFQDKITQKGLTFNVNVDSRIPPIFFTDHERFAQILINLLSNAVKFTTHGSINISAAFSNETIVIIAVKDTGVGMGNNAQQRLRKKLTGETINDRISTDSVGIGVGSFISNKLAKKLSPKEEVGLEFVSKKGRGSYFYFELENRKPKGDPNLGITTLGGFLQQLDTDEKCNAERSILEHQTFSIKNTFKLHGRKECDVKVLVVDDEIFNIIVIENFCKSFGILVEKAFHGQEAMTKLDQSQQDGAAPIKIIFMDINMPVMDGYETSLLIQERIRKKEINGLVIIGVTAYVSGDAIEKCYKCGMSDVLNKPVSKEGLINILRKYEILE